MAQRCFDLQLAKCIDDIYIYIFILLMYVFKLVYVKHSKQHLELHGIVRVLSIRGEDVNGRYEGT